MPVRFYMDQHVPRAVIAGVRLRGVDVLTAFEDGASELSDPDLLDRAGALGRVLFSQDEDLLVEAARRQREGVLELIAKASEHEDLVSRVEILPL